MYWIGRVGLDRAKYNTIRINLLFVFRCLYNNNLIIIVVPNWSRLFLFVQVNFVTIYCIIWLHSLVLFRLCFFHRSGILELLHFFISISKFCFCSVLFSLFSSFARFLFITFMCPLFSHLEQQIVLCIVLVVFVCVSFRWMFADFYPLDIRFEMSMDEVNFSWNVRMLNCPKKQNSNQ